MAEGGPEVGGSIPELMGTEPRHLDLIQLLNVLKGLWMHYHFHKISSFSSLSVPQL